MARLTFLLFFALLSAGVTLAQQRPPPVPSYSPPSCAIKARLTGNRSFLGQQLLEISLPPACPADAGRLARIITTNGGRIPPVGYLRLGGGFPRRWTYWVLGKVQVQDRAAPNVWVTVPLGDAL